METDPTPSDSLSAVLVSDQGTQCLVNVYERSVSEIMELKETKILDELSSPVCGGASLGVGGETGEDGEAGEETGDGCGLKRACDLTNELMAILNDLHERQNSQTSLERQASQERLL